jgi:hypothetical protein
MSKLQDNFANTLSALDQRVRLTNIVNAKFGHFGARNHLFSEKMDEIF